MNDQESVVEYFTQILTLRNQMKNYGEKLEDVMVIGKIMRTLTPRFDYIVVAIEQGTDLEGMKVEEPTGILEAQELRLNERNSMRSSDQALQAQTYKGNSNNGGKNKKGKENGRTKGRTLVKIQAIGTRVIMKKTTRRMVEKIRNSTRKGSSAIIVKNGIILLMNVRARKCQERKMKLNWHMMRVLILMIMYC